MRLFFFFLCFLMTACSSCAANLEVDSDESSLQGAVDFVTWENCSQQVGDHPCDFTMQNQDDESVSLYDFYGKVVVVDFSVMWCGPCISMAQSSSLIVQDYGAENVEWVTILIENEYGNAPDTEDLNRWIAMTGTTGNVLASNRDIIDPTATSGYPVGGWPTFVVINDEMIMTHHVKGWSEEILRQILDSL